MELIVLPVVSCSVKVCQLGVRVKLKFMVGPLLKTATARVPALAAFARTTRYGYVVELVDPGNHVTPNPGLEPLKLRISPSLVAVTPMSFAHEIVEEEGSLLARSLKLLS